MCSGFHCTLIRLQIALRLFHGITQVVLAVDKSSELIKVLTQRFYVFPTACMCACVPVWFYLNVCKWFFIFLCGGPACLPLYVCDQVFTMGRRVFGAAEALTFTTSSPLALWRWVEAIRKVKCLFCPSFLLFCHTGDWINPSYLPTLCRVRAECSSNLRNVALATSIINKKALVRGEMFPDSISFPEQFTSTPVHAFCS